MKLTNIDMQVGVAILGKQLFCQYNNWKGLLMPQSICSKEQLDSGIAVVLHD